MIKTTVTAIAVALAMASAANAVTGVPSQYQPGGGCFNFQMNGAQYSIPYLGNDPAPPRGGASAIDGWISTLLAVPRGTVSFAVGERTDAATCGLQGFTVTGITSP